jgi:hypothetical protein
MLHSLKSKLKPKLSTSPGDKERVKRACAAGISGLQTTLRIANEVAGNAAVPGLQTGISSLIYILDVIKVRGLHKLFDKPLIMEQNTMRNAEDVEKLTTQIEALTTILEHSKEGGNLPPAAIERIGRLSA